MQIKQEYIEHGKKLRSEREANLEKLKIELEAAKQRVDERKGVKSILSVRTACDIACDLFVIEW